MSKQIIQTTKAPAPIGPYSQAIIANGLLFVSGQVALVPETGELETGSIQDETQRVMKNIGAVLDEAHITFEHLIKTTIFLSDMNLFAQVNEVYGSFFKGDYPARETVAVKGLPKGVNVEISVTAVMEL
ncbi:MAG: RidA family protein [Sediminibacterium sp.]